MADSDLKKILVNQKLILKKLDLIQREEIQELNEEKKVEEYQLAQADELKNIEESVKKKTKSSPLKKITYHDITKGFVGAFAGIVGHFAFIYGTKIADDISIARAWTILGFSLVLLILFIYFTGFRKVEMKNKFIPLRALTIFVTALVTIIMVLSLFGFINSASNLEEVFKQVSAISVLAMLGAGAADMVGGE